MDNKEIQQEKTERQEIIPCLLRHHLLFTIYNSLVHLISANRALAIRAWFVFG